MIINVLTISRPGQNYLGSTLASLCESDWCQLPVNLILGSSDERHVSQYRDRFKVVSWDKDSKRIHVNFCLNYIRALRHDHREDVVICEDDIEFSRDWLARLLLAVREIPLAKYVLSLYTAHDLSDQSNERGRHHRAYGARGFWGTQAVFYPGCVRLEIAKYIEDNIERKPGDLLIGEWCAKHECLYMTQGSLVQHMGEQTSGLGKFHTAWNYVGEQACKCSSVPGPERIEHDTRGSPGPHNG
jgi:hypothetical protein